MVLDQTTVAKIARLARLHIDAQEVDRYVQELSRILELAEQMNAVDTAAVTPMAHPQDQPLRLRDDAVTEADARETFQELAPAVEAGLYLVPKVIE